VERKLGFGRGENWMVQRATVLGLDCGARRKKLTSGSHSSVRGRGLWLTLSGLSDAGPGPSLELGQNGSPGLFSIFFISFPFLFSVFQIVSYLLKFWFKSSQTNF
jgi:hypothetical protein